MASVHEVIITPPAKLVALNPDKLPIDLDNDDEQKNPDMIHINNSDEDKQKNPSTLVTMKTHPSANHWIPVLS
ncbi:hypothetical protein PtB15_2B198 [Puccinia triticina]|nr:hypothetical protein PtB15_2B198 [Puccinia triticina]